MALGLAVFLQGADKFVEHGIWPVNVIERDLLAELRILLVLERVKQIESLPGQRAFGPLVTPLAIVTRGHMPHRATDPAMRGDDPVFKLKNDHLARVAPMPAPGQIPSDGVRADRIRIEGIAHHVKVVDAHVREEHVRLGHVMATRIVRPIHIERDVELRHVANALALEQPPGRARQGIEAIVLRDHVFDTRFFARFNHALGRLKIIAQGLFAQEVEARIKGFHRNGFVNRGRRDIHRKIGLHGCGGFAEVRVDAIRRYAAFFNRTGFVFIRGFDIRDQFDFGMLLTGGLPMTRTTTEANENCFHRIAPSGFRARTGLRPFVWIAD